jgi:hypothetical protein
VLSKSKPVKLLRQLLQADKSKLTQVSIAQSANVSRNSTALRV